MHLTQSGVLERFQKADISRMRNRNWLKRQEDKWCKVTKGNQVELRDAESDRGNSA